jgi:hypothetical protein
LLAFLKTPQAKEHECAQAQAQAKSNEPQSYY